MFHLKRWNQHYLYLESTCNYMCISCNLTKPSINTITAIVKKAKKNDILNIYGGNPMLHPQFMATLRHAKHNQLSIRLWTNHTISELNQNELSTLIDDCVIWCPSPLKEGFNETVGRNYFDIFSKTIKRLKIKKTLSFNVRPLSFDVLPEFYDLVVDSNASGMILYNPKEFTKEEHQYIKRFKRVNHIRIIKIKDTPTRQCLAVPNTIGTNSFEFDDWKHHLKTSLKRLAFLRPFIR